MYIFLKYEKLNKHKDNKISIQIIGYTTLGLNDLFRTSNHQKQKENLKFCSSLLMIPNLS